MNPFRPVLLLFPAFVLAFLLSLSQAHAEELYVNNADTTCSASATTTPTCYTSIQAAIDTAYYLNSTQTTTIYSVFVEAGTYTESITLHGITVRGRETAATIIQSSGTGTLVTADFGSSAISNFTFYNASVYTAVTNTASLAVVNNVFFGNSSNTGVQVRGSGSAAVRNNIFYYNGTAVSSNADIEITNNIFLTNGTALSAVSPLTTSTWTLISYNDFYTNTSIGITITFPDTATHNIDTDPLVVDLASNDFHLLSSSGCIGTGNPLYVNAFNSTSDIGAYGGPSTDTIPYAITLASATSDTTTNTITVTWNANSDYRVAGYKLYYGTASGVYDGTDATEGASPISVGNVTSSLLSSLTASTASLSSSSTPSITSITPGNQSLVVSWDAVSGATGYRVWYEPGDTFTTPTTTYQSFTSSPGTLTGLTNGQNYNIAVTAVAQATYYVNVTAIDNTSGPFEPGVQHESYYYTSNELSVAIGNVASSPSSSVVVAFPEAVTAFPNLPGTSKGCFIATAAYGSYSSPEVLLLRKLRDQYLATNNIGRAFVAWYYRNSPAAAAWLNDHPALKPLVRTLLLPLVGFSLFLTNTTLATKLVILFVVLCGLFLLRRQFARSAASRAAVVAIVLLAFPSVAPASDYGALEQSQWSFEVKGGQFKSALSGWDTYYGSQDMPIYGVSLGYKITSMFELGAEVESLKAKGQGYLPQHQTTGGNVTYQAYPVNLFVLFRGQFKENQWFVPYAGGGFTRMLYRQTVEGQSTVSGKADGYHARGGLMLLLDDLDRDAASSMYKDYGVYHTYFFVEAAYIKAKVKAVSADLGGTSWLAGLLFEY